MSWSYRSIPELELCLVCLEGTVDRPVLHEVIQAIIEDEGRRSTFRHLWDTRGVSELVLMPEDVNSILRGVAANIERIGSGRTAVLVHREIDEVAGHMFFSRLTDGRSRQVVHSLEEALDWLDIAERSAVQEVLQEGKNAARSSA